MSAFALLIPPGSLQVSLHRLTERSATSYNFKKNYKSTDLHMILAPLHLRRRNSIRPVSCYAIFKGWLLLSQLPAVKEFPHPFTLNHNFGPYLVVWALSLSTMDLSTHSLSAEEQCLAFGVLLGLARISSPSPFSALPLNIYLFNAYLNSFRGKPAIYEFGWPFTLTTSHPKTFQRLVRPPASVTLFSTCSW